jgi:putative transposase
MPRLPRQIKMDADGVYHLRGQVAGAAGYYPFHDAENADQLLAIIRHFTSLFFCQVVELTILGNHYHLVCLFEAFRELSREELLAVAQRFYPDPRYQPYLRWKDADWERFNRRLFNVSELMRNVQSGYARWFNQRHQRKGRFWADRFRSTESENLQETAFYVALNPVRAHLCQVPEQWCYGSAWLRKHGKDDWLMPLEELMDHPGESEEAERLYWTGLYWRGTEPSKENDGWIPVELAEKMERENFGRGCYLRPIPAFSRGRVVGSLPTVELALSQHRTQELYTRRRKPIPLGVGDLHALREQRSNYVSI